MGRVEQQGETRDEHQASAHAARPRSPAHPWRLGRKREPGAVKATDRWASLAGSKTQHRCEPVEFVISFWDGTTKRYEGYLTRCGIKRMLFGFYEDVGGQRCRTCLRCIARERLAARRLKDISPPTP